MPPRRTAPKANEKLVVRPRRGQEGRAPAAPFIVQRTHQENQERAYVAASRRTDRGLHARMESARRASAIHKERTGRGFRITEEDVMNEEMYEEEDDDSTIRFEELRDDMSGTAQRFRQQLSDYVLSMEPQNPSVYLPEMGQHNLSPGGQARQTEIIDDYRVGQLRAAQWQQIHETSDGIYRTAHPVAVEFQTLRAERQQLPSEIRLDEMRRQQTEHMRALGHEGYVPTSLPEQLYPTAASYSPRPIRHPLDPDPMAQNPMAQHPMAQHTMARHPMAPHPMDPHPRAHYRMAQQPVQRGAWPSSIRYSPYGARGLPHPQQEPPATLDITPLDYIIDADFDSGFIGPRSRYVPYFEPAVGNSVSTAAAETAGPNGTSTGPNSSNIPGPFESGSTSPPSMGDETSFFPGLFSDTPGSPFASNFGDPAVNNEPELQENKPEQTENEATSDPGTFFRDPPAQVRSQIPSSTPAPNPVAPGELGATPDSDGLADLVEPQTGKFWYTAEEWDMTFDGEL